MLPPSPYERMVKLSAIVGRWREIMQASLRLLVFRHGTCDAVHEDKDRRGSLIIGVPRSVLKSDHRTSEYKQSDSGEACINLSKIQRNSEIPTKKDQLPLIISMMRSPLSCSNLHLIIMFWLAVLQLESEYCSLTDD